VHSGGSSLEYLGERGHGPMASAVHKPITGVWGGAPNGVQWQSPWLGFRVWGGKTI